MVTEGRVTEEAPRSALLEVAMRIRTLFLVLAGGLAAAGGAANAGTEIEDFVGESRAMVKAFAENLKSELQGAIKSGGPVHAIPVCNVRAPEIAAELSKPGQWTIGRTSHKTRNPSNAPDDWETGVLEEFRRRAAAGESLDGMEKVELIESDGGTTYRYMKAIPVGQVCLTCHGSDIAPNLKAEIDTYYPEDRATGLELGEIRGAFTITKAPED
jgi:hypothetical protein